MVPGNGWTVLMVVSVTAIASTASTAVPASTSICQKSPINLFMEFYKCDDSYIKNTAAYNAVYGEGQTPTKANLLEVSHVQCTEGKAAAKACFRDIIMDCNSTLQAQLNNLIATGTGFLCLPGEGGVEPAIANVINSMNDAGLAEAKESPCSVNNTCFGHIDINWGEESPDSLASSMQSAVPNYARCLAEKYQAAQVTCSNWRENLLFNNLRPLFSYGHVGVRLSFSQQDLNDLFEASRDQCDAMKLVINEAGGTHTRG